MIKRKSINILAAPAHYFITDKLGSEFYWSYGLMKAITDVFDVRYTAITQVIPDINEEMERVNIKRVTSFDKPRFGPQDAVQFSWRCFREAKRMLKGARFDLIHHVLPFKYERSVSLLVLLGCAKGLPFVIGPLQPPATMIGDDETGFHSGRIDRELSRFGSRICAFSMNAGIPLMKRLFIHTIRNSDALVVVNDYTREIYQKYVFPEKIKIIPPGIDTENFKYSISAERKGKEILAVGYLLKRKGFDYLVKAFARLEKEFSSLKLRIIGDGPQLLALKELAEGYGIGVKVIFEGYIPRQELPAFYQRADILCHPSLSEGHSTTIVEAMASGLPVVAARNIGSQGIVQDGITGFLVPPQDFEALGEALHCLIENKTLRLKMGQEARKVVERKYSWQVVAEKWFSIYTTLISKKHNEKSKINLSQFAE